MKHEFSIENHTAHLWHVSIPTLLSQLENLSKLLSSDELQRANRFRFPEHRERFIVARGILREILHCYTGIPAPEIQFSYGPRGKPYLLNNPQSIQFNVSHSHDLAVYALTIENEIGIDIEKMEAHYNDAVAKRFFSEEEYAQLAQLSDAEKIVGFYKIWSFKEAIIKLVGEGLYVPLNEFSIDLHKSMQTILFTHQNQSVLYHLENVQVHADYQAAFAMKDPVEKRIFWEWERSGPKVLDRPNPLF